MFLLLLFLLFFIWQWQQGAVASGIISFTFDGYGVFLIVDEIKCAIVFYHRTDMIIFTG